MGIFNLLAKPLGVIGLGLVGYDCHVSGALRSTANAQEYKAQSLESNYLDNMSMASPSIVRQKIKQGLFRFNVDENFSPFFNGISGYLKGFGSMLAHNLIPLGLSVGALFGKGASKYFGAGLLLYGGIFLAQEIFGIGKPKY